MSKSIESVRIVHEYDQDPDLSYLDDDMWPGDEETQALNRVRRETYGAQWNCIGIYAEAHLVVDDTAQTVQGGGLWGVESDSDTAYLQEIAEDGLSDLRTVLNELGFDDDEIDAAFADVDLLP